MIPLEKDSVIQKIKEKIPACFGSQDLEFGQHHNDEVEAKELKRLAKEKGITSQEMVQLFSDFLSEKKENSEHYNEQLSEIRRFFLHMTIDRFEMLVSEICVKGHVEEFRKTVNLLIKRIQESNCKIYWSDRNDPIKIEQSLDPIIPNIIRLTHKSSEMPLEVFWKILHEFAHHLSGKPTHKLTEDETREREIKAWRLAEEELNNYSELLPHIKNFYEYKAECLKTYQIHHL